MVYNVVSISGCELVGNPICCFHLPSLFEVVVAVFDVPPDDHIAHQNYKAWNGKSDAVVKDMRADTVQVRLDEVTLPAPAVVPKCTNSLKKIV